MVEKKQRDKSLDLISGVLVIWMILYHSFQWGKMIDTSIFKYMLSIFFFFMPWFYFKSGYLLNTKGSYKEIIRKGFIQLIFPMIIWTAVGYIITIPELISEGASFKNILSIPVLSFIRHGNTAGNLPLWFLFSLFVFRLLTKLLANISNFYLLFLIIILSFLAYKLYIYNMHIQLGMESWPLGLSFTLFGLLVRRTENNLNLKHRVFYLLIAILIILGYFESTYVDIHQNECWFGKYPLFILNSMLVIVIVKKHARLLSVSFIEWVGTKTIYFLALHWPIIFLSNMVISYLAFPLNGFFYTIFIFTISMLVCSIIAKSVEESKIGLDGSVIWNYFK